ncbi:MAG: glycerol kinase [Actinomycetia bacterium]|nr:glycerol kinase [Actinomycetes bacterium]
MSCIVAIDAGTTGVRAFAVGDDSRPRARSYREFPQHFPRPGWVEHDADDIWRATVETLAEVAGQLDDMGETIAAIGITNQRETVVVWDRRTGAPRARAIVWQDRRTAERCDELRAAGHEPMIRRATGLVLDPYFSGSKLSWLLHTGGVTVDDDLRFGTVDSWLLWKLTGGPDGGVHATDPSNASRTMLYDIGSADWSDELCSLFEIPRAILPEVRPSSGRFGVTVAEHAAGLRVPVSGIAGDQQSALFGHACVAPGMTKNTYGTGSFVLTNIGETLPEPVDGLLTTIAWSLGAGPVTYAMEGAIFVTGAAVQWLRDGLGVIGEAAEIGPLAATVPDAGGVFVVPAFTGLGSPWWDPYARGTIVGITRGTTRGHLARAVVEAMAFQTADVIDAITRASGTAPPELRVDGGAAVMDLLCQFQADLLGVTVRRAAIQETTALGAAFLAGLGEHVWDSPAEVNARWSADASFTPTMTEAERTTRESAWHRAVERSRDWSHD